MPDFIVQSIQFDAISGNIENPSTDIGEIWFDSSSADESVFRYSPASGVVYTVASREFVYDASGYIVSLISNSGGITLTQLLQASGELSNRLIQSGQILVASDNLLNTAVITQSGNLIQSGQILTGFHDLQNTALATASGNLIQSGQTLVASDNLLNIAVNTQSGNLIQSGQILRAVDTQLNTAIITLSGLTTGFTSGSVLFAGPTGNIAQDSNNFYWDNTSKRLGLRLSGIPYALLQTGDRTLEGVEIGGAVSSPHFSFGEYTNYLVNSENFTSGWAAIGVSLTGNVSDPQGRLKAFQVSGTATNGTLVHQISDTASGSPWNFSMWMRSDSYTAVQFMVNTDRQSGTASLIRTTPLWQRFSYTESGLIAPNSFKKATLIVPTNGQVVQIWGAQLDSNAVMRPYAQTSGNPITTVTNKAIFRSDVGISGALTLELPLAILEGGTGQRTASGAITALSGTRAKGDLIVYNSVSGAAARFPIGSSGNVLVADPFQSAGMRWGIVDSQSASSTSGVTTTSATFVDLTNATLTTAAGTSPRNYIITWSGTFSTSNNPRVITIRIIVDGVPLTETQRSFTNQANLSQFSLAANKTMNIPPDKIIKVQWLISGGNTGTCIISELSIFGI